MAGKKREDKAWRHFKRKAERITPALYRIGVAIMRKKREELKAARGKTHDRFRFEVDKEGRAVEIVQESRALGFLRDTGQPSSHLHLMQENGGDHREAERLLAEHFKPRPKRNRSRKK